VVEGHDIVAHNTPGRTASTGGVACPEALVYDVHMTTTRDLKAYDTIPFDIALVLKDGFLAIYRINEVPPRSSIEERYFLGEGLNWIWEDVMEDVARLVGEPDGDIVSLFDKHLKDRIFI
jgi:hypothetical protein